MISLAIPLLAAACATDTSSECKMAHVTDLKLLHPSGPMLTPAFLNGQPTTMMLDSGAELTIITKPAADRLHLSLRSTGGYLSGVGGHQDLYFFTADSFRIGELHGKRLVLGSSAIGLDPHHVLVDGIFGADFLSNYDIDFDLPEQKLRLFSIIAGCSTPSAELDEPLFVAPFTTPDTPRDRRAHVMVLIDGIRLNAVVDSGAHHTAIYRNAARRLGLRVEDLTSDRRGHAVGVGPAVRDVIQHIMAPIQIGEITVSNLPVEIIDQRSDGDADMLLGQDFFARIHVWLSFHSRTMIMQYPAKPSPKPAGE